MGIMLEIKRRFRGNSFQCYPRSSFRGSLLIGALLFGISLSYLFLSVAHRPQPLSPDHTTELYALLARSFLQGRTSLPLEPRPELLSLPDPYDPVANSKYRLLDASLYKGQYYLYFGAVPVVTLFLPFRLVTGQDLPNRVAVAIFCIGGFLSSCALFFLVTAHNNWDLPFSLQCAVIVSLGSMSLVSLILRRPLFYEVAIASGYCFVMLGFLIIGMTILGRRAASKWLLLAGLMFGLAVGCRPHLVVICGIVLGAFAIRLRRNPRLVIALATGMVVCGILIGWYNYARFDNPLEFGRTYQLTAFSVNPSLAFHSPGFNLRGFLYSAEEFLFLPLRVDASMPFLHTALINPLSREPARVVWTEGMVGLTPAAPFALLGCLAPLLLSRRIVSVDLFDNTSAWLVYTMYWSGVGVFLSLCLVGWVIGRYLVDFAPLLTFAGVSVVTLLWQALAGHRTRSAFSWGVGATVIYGVLVNVALATPTGGQLLNFVHK